MSCASLATPGTEVCDAVGRTFRPEWREWPARAIRRVLSTQSQVLLKKWRPTRPGDHWSHRPSKMGDLLAWRNLYIAGDCDRRGTVKFPCCSLGLVLLLIS